MEKKENSFKICFFLRRKSGTFITILESVILGGVAFYSTKKIVSAWRKLRLFYIKQCLMAKEKNIDHRFFVIINKVQININMVQ